MQLANLEAQRFNHEYIGTEHVLLGIVKVGDSPAASILTRCGVRLPQICQEVEKMVPSGPDMVTMGKLPQTPHTKMVLEHAVQEARDLGHQHVGTEHLLLGLLREEEGVAAQVLRGLGVNLDEARAAVLALFERESAGTALASSVSPAPGESITLAVTLSPKAVESFQQLQELSGRTTLEGVLVAALRVYLPAEATFTVRRVPRDSEQGPS
ncbi:MAG: Clp protease N-terminal domain-containing protein [bacterium]|nr:Clp protease N-terminal domain-containing protein [bacterium]